jgi:hypothetical protein
MAVAGQSTGGSTRLSLSVRFKWLLHQLKSSGHGFDLYRQISATDAVTYLHNRPELLEYPGILNLFGLYSDYTVSLELQHSGLQGRIRPGIRNPDPIELTAQRSLAYLAPLVHVSDPADPRATAEAELVPAALDHAVISYLDSRGVYEAAVTVLGGLTGPQGNADQELRAFTGTIMMRAFFKEIARKLYSSDQFFDPGIIRDTFGAVSVSAKLGRARFTGSTPSNFVSGNIYLGMGQTSQSQSDSWGVRAVQTSPSAAPPSPETRTASASSRAAWTRAGPGSGTPPTVRGVPAPRSTSSSTSAEPTSTPCRSTSRSATGWRSTASSRSRRSGTTNASSGAGRCACCSPSRWPWSGTAGGPTPCPSRTSSSSTR